MRYRSIRADDAAHRLRIRELAAARRRFGYRRLHLSAQEGGCDDEPEAVPAALPRGRLTGAQARRTQTGARHPRTDHAAIGPNERWSLDFVSDSFTDGRRFRVLAVVDDCTRECLGLVADTSLSGAAWRENWTPSIARRGRPKTCVSDNGTEFTSMAILKWSQRAGRLALHPARQAAAECLRRELHRPPARRMPERDAFSSLSEARACLPRGGTIKSGTAAFGTRQPHAGGVPAHLLPLPQPTARARLHPGFSL